MPKVVIVDDDKDYLDSMAALLELEGYDVFPYPSFKEMYAAIDQVGPHILILDINLPSESAFDYLPDLRQKTAFGLIIVSGNADVSSRIAGLEKGADNYFTKPVNLKELSVTIRSLYNRLFPDTRPSWRLLRNRCVLITPTGDEVQLTHSEYTFIELLVKSGEAPVNSDELLRALGKRTDSVQNNTLYTLISRLRKKFDKLNHALPVRAVRHSGYVFFETVVLVS